jgi:uncharacterized membrane protein
MRRDPASILDRIRLQDRHLNAASPLQQPNCRSAGVAALLVGFSIGGLFDGILLHQILQWHHLLSGVRRPWLVDLRAQVLWTAFLIF